MSDRKPEIDQVEHNRYVREYLQGLANNTGKTNEALVVIGGLLEKLVEVADDNHAAAEYGAKRLEMLVVHGVASESRDVKIIGLLQHIFDQQRMTNQALAERREQASENTNEILGQIADFAVKNHNDQVTASVQANELLEAITDFSVNNNNTLALRRGDASAQTNELLKAIYGNREAVQAADKMAQSNIRNVIELLELVSPKLVDYDDKSVNPYNCQLAGFGAKDLAGGVVRSGVALEHPQTSIDAMKFDNDLKCFSNKEYGKDRLIEQQHVRIEEICAERDELKKLADRQMMALVASQDNLSDAYRWVRENCGTMGYEKLIEWMSENARKN